MMLRFETYRDWKLAVEARGATLNTEYDDVQAEAEDGMIGWSYTPEHDGGYEGDHVLFDSAAECNTWMNEDAGDFAP